MKFVPTKFDTAWLVKIDPHLDNRGAFARTWCTEEFRHHGLNDRLVQCSVSYNEHVGTLRGMHFQIPPFQECKLIRCTRGAIFDVIVDCRPESPTLGSWEGFYLNEENRDSLYIPEGFAHGFQALSTETEVLYQMNQFHQPDCARGFHHLDKNIRINWPKSISIVSMKDQQAGAFSECIAELQDLSNCLSRSPD